MVRSMEAAGLSGPKSPPLRQIDHGAIPVLQISASYKTSPERVRGGSGADAYLAKPLTDELVATVKALLRIHDAERARRESEARYDFLFERNSLPTWILDLESLEFLAVNEAAVRHYGYSRDEFLAMTVENIRVSDDTANEFSSRQPDAVRNRNNCGTRRRRVDHRRRDRLPGTLLSGPTRGAVLAKTSPSASEQERRCEKARRVSE